MKAGFQGGVALAKIGGLAIKVGADVMAALPDGVSAEEAEKIAVDAIADEDLRVMVKGVDVLDERAQELLAAFLARVTRNVTEALTAGP